MNYHVTGEFIEACDCRVICPCWVDQLPDNGSCTGFFAWSLAAGSTVGDVDVSGHRVVSVSTHLGRRSPGAGTPGSDQGVTMLYLTAAAGTPEYDKLVALFRGDLGGPVADIIKVIDSPPLVAPQTADISFQDDTSVTVTVTTGAKTEQRVSATIEAVVGADGQQTTVAHQQLDPKLDTLRVARNTAIDLAVPYPTNPAPKPAEDPGLADTFLFDFTQPGYSASSGHFDYQHDDS